MIEVPAAAIALPGFIGAVDFLSIGTNDLVQYLLAADRNNEALGELYTPLHPAVLRLLHDVIRIAHERGKPVAVCGEMAGDATFAPLLLALGLAEFSLHPATLLEAAPRDPRVRPGGAAGTRAGAAARARPRGHRGIGWKPADHVDRLAAIDHATSRRRNARRWMHARTAASRARR